MAPTRLSTPQLERLRNNIRRSPRELGYDQNLWDGVLLSHHLTKEYSISLSVRQCQRLFHGLGFSLQRPSRQPSEAKPELQNAFKKLLPMDERPLHPALVRGRSPFPATQQSHTNVGAQGTAASRALALLPRQSGLLRDTRPQNRNSPLQRSFHFQCRDLWRFCPLPSSIYSRENLPYSGQMRGGTKHKL